VSPPPAAGSPSLAHRIQYGAFRLVRRLLMALPAWLALGAGEVLGWVAGVIIRTRRRVVDENLLQAFPDRDPAWRARVARGAYRHLARESVVTFRMAGASRKEIRDSVTADAAVLEAVRADLAKGRGLVVVSGHLGNWEMGGAWLAANDIPVDAVVQVQRNRRFDDDLRGVREQLGMRVVPKQKAPRGVLRALRAGRVAALVADQNVARGGIFVDFLGRSAATARGPAVFALRSGAPLWLAAAIRTSRHPQRYRARLERIAVELTGDLEVDVRRLTEAYTTRLESWIRAEPEQYFWHHKRWKTRPAILERPSSGDHITSD
jgi:KDO2-lipid IV(A) lauroyltransferase